MPPARPCPFPEDFVFDGENFEARICGPIDKDDLLAVLRIRLRRTSLILDFVGLWDCKAFGEEGVGAYFTIINQAFQAPLPKRWRLDYDGLVGEIAYFKGRSARYRDHESIILDHTIELLGPPAVGPSGNKPREQRRNDDIAKKLGHAPFDAMNRALDADRRAQTTRKMARTASERLEAMKRDDIDIEKEWQRRKGLSA